MTAICCELHNLQLVEQQRKKTEPLIITIVCSPGYKLKVRLLSYGGQQLLTSCGLFMLMEGDVATRIGCLDSSIFKAELVMNHVKNPFIDQTARRFGPTEIHDADRDKISPHSFHRSAYEYVVLLRKTKEFWDVIEFYCRREVQARLMSFSQVNKQTPQMGRSVIDL